MSYFSHLQNWDNNITIQALMIIISTLKFLWGINTINNPCEEMNTICGSSLELNNWVVFVFWARLSSWLDLNPPWRYSSCWCSFSPVPVLISTSFLCLHWWCFGLPDPVTLYMLFLTEHVFLRIYFFAWEDESVVSFLYFHFCHIKGNSFLVSFLLFVNTPLWSLYPFLYISHCMLSFSEKMIIPLSYSFLLLCCHSR